MQNILVNVNGDIHSADKATVSVFDRGYLYGDSLYEVARSYDGIFLHLDDHLYRMEKSAELCHMVLGQPTELYHSEIYRTFAEFRKLPGHAKTEAYCRILVTRGVGKIGFGLNCILTPTQYVIIVQPVEPPSEEQFNHGMNLQISKRLRNDARALDPAMKSGNYLNSLLAYLEANAQDCDDAVMCNSDGHITEGTTFNIFYIRNNILATPPLDIGILDGITRRQVIRIAGEMGLPVREVRFPRERMDEADEVFMTGSVKEVFPITRIDGKPVGSGKPGKLTREIAKRYRQSCWDVVALERNAKKSKAHAR
ncbi:MAG: aminotransferase class IV family protein [Methylotenera sp.]|nr:aminotransferase class IV family protein [Oligoflexia bacterium]